MAHNTDLSTATSSQIEATLCAQVEGIRLSRNMTQQQLAEEAGVSLRTIGRLEKGQGVSLDTFIRVLTALRLQQNLAGLLPDPSVRPIERVGPRAVERKRARPTRPAESSKAWSWAEGEDDNAE
jgi:transcriptional regulator with XRE-family HTH domain